MNLRHKLNNRTFKLLCLLLVGGAIALAGFKFFASVDRTQQEESSKRKPGLDFRRLSLQDEKGIVAPDGLQKARKHIELMKKEREKNAAKNKNQIQEAGVIAESWTWLGPGNIGGRIRSIVIHPTNPNLMFVGSVSGGIWRTTNGGVSWSPVNDFMANLAVVTLVINPINSSIMYAGTGEGFGNTDAILGAGIFRSTDGGATWTQIPATDNPNWNYVRRLAISPDGLTMLAATGSGIWRSTNGGATWTQTHPDTNGRDIDFHPTDSNRAIFSGDGGSSYSDDGGQTWNASSFSPGVGGGRVETAYAPSDPNIVYASANIARGEVYRSTNGGENFSRVNTGLEYLGKQGWYNNIIWVNPQDEDFVIIGGIHLLRSTDGGETFTEIADGNSGSAHDDHHFIITHPSFNNTTNKIAFFGNDGGIYRTNDVSTVSLASGWTELNNNLGITQFYGAAGNNSTGIIIGGTQDNGTLRFSGGTEDWTKTAGADGGFCAADQTNSNYFYGELQDLAVFRSSNAGVSADDISGGITDRTSGADGDCECNFISPLTLDPNNANRLLAGGKRLWRTNDARAATPTWDSIRNSQLAYHSAISIAPDNSDFIVVGDNGGGIFLTTNGTNSSPDWTQIDAANVPARMVTRLTIDASRSPNPWIYATFGGFSADNVYVTKNLGATWTDITGTGVSGLPDVPVRSLTFHPRNPNLLYIGTEVGIFSSDDAGVNWDLPNGGPANVSVDELFFVAGDLIAATHGRGLYRASGGLYVDCNYNGVQLGTFDQPFKTVNAAINALTSYRPIWLKPCNYNEQIAPTTKKFELRSLGGTATIGTP